MKDTISIGIAGGTGSRKSTFARRLAERFEGNVSMIYHDNYYRDLSHLTFEERKKVNYDHPDSLETELLIEHLKELKEGSSFEAAAAEHSTDRYTAPYGGDLGFVNDQHENVPAEYLEKAEQLKENQWVDEPIKTSQGYAIIQLKEKLPGQAFTYSEVKNQIRRQIAMDQLGDKASVKTLWKDAKVSWFYDDKK